MKYYILLLVFALALSGCSVELTAVPASPAPTASFATPTEMAITSPLITNGTAVATVSEQTATVVPTPAPLSVTWAGLKLTGTLVYNTVDSTMSILEIHALDLTTGNRRLIFHLPETGWCDAVAVAPDQHTLLLAYSPPMDQPYGGLEALYTMDLNTPGLPTLLFNPPSNQDQYSQPVWSPDGKYIY